MLFRELKQGDIIHILDKRNMTLREASVGSVSVPHIDSYNSLRTTAQMIVDVTAHVDGQQKTFAIPDTLSVTYAGDMVLCSDRDTLIREVRLIQSQAKERIDSHDSDVQCYDRCTELLVELSPELKEKQETEARLSRMEDAINKMATLIEKLGG